MSAKLFLSYPVGFVLLSTLFLSSCRQGRTCTTRQPVAIPSSYAVLDTVSVMSFNVENLFDTVNDPEKNDETFLPLSQKNSAEHRAACSRVRGASRRQLCLNLDWSKPVLAAKLQRLSEVILAVDEGRGPDILILSEVENMEVLEMLRERLTPAEYHQPVHLVGPDPRGIDTAVMSRFKLHGKAQLHKIPYSRAKGGILNSRAILELDLKLPNQQLASVFAVHFPAPYHPLEMRQAAFRHLNQLAAIAAKRSQLVIAGGDFNVKAEEDSRLYRQLASEHWWVSHLVGCKQCLGTHYFAPRDSWSFLDAVMLWQASENWRMEPSSIRIVNEVPGQADTRHGFPKSFDPRRLVGVSDHFPVKVRLSLVEPMLELL